MVHNPFNGQKSRERNYKKGVIMKKIPLTQGKFALVDDKNYKDLMQFKWYALHQGNTFYAVRNVWIDGKRTAERMHRRILGLKLGDGKHTDHINHNGLDNQLNNIRVCTHKENHQNQKKSSNNTSRFKGVHWDKQHKKWRAMIMVNFRKKHLGYFDDKIDAAKIYNKTAVEYFELNISENLLI
jgi:hypothetical protein